jgi:DNA uptake protein ComE-like DNA-binding protein
MKEAMGFGTSQFRAKEEGARICPKTASRRALKTITLGNGKIADEIIKNRPYKNKEELEKVMGPQLYRIFEHRIEIKEPVVDAKPHVKDTLPGEPPAREEPSGVEEDVIPLK